MDETAPPKKRRVRVSGRYASGEDLQPGVSFGIDGVLRVGDPLTWEAPDRKLQTFRVVGWEKGEA